MQNVGTPALHEAVDAYRARNEGQLQIASAGHAAAQTALVKTTIPVVQQELIKLYEETKQAQIETDKQFHVKGQEIEVSKLDRALKEMSVRERAMTLPAIIDMVTNDDERSKLGLPALRNASEAEKSWWKRVISPYLDDVGKVLGGASTAAGAAGNIKYLGEK
jgi:hypothetical protein